MRNAVRLALSLFLALAGVLAFSAPVMAVAPVIAGFVYDTNGNTLLKNPQVNVKVTDSMGNIIGTATSSSTTAAYSITFTGNPQADNIINITFQRVGGIGTVSVQASYLQPAKISPLVPQ